MHDYRSIWWIRVLSVWSSKRDNKRLFRDRSNQRLFKGQLGVPLTVYLWYLLDSPLGSGYIPAYPLNYAIHSELLLSSVCMVAKALRRRSFKQWLTSQWVCKLLGNRIWDLVNLLETFWTFWCTGGSVFINPGLTYVDITNSTFTKTTT